MNISFLGSGRCFHTQDWYSSAKVISEELGSNLNSLNFVTDQLDGEGEESFLNEDDQVILLHRIDPILFNHWSKIGSIWRNIVKLVMLPFQVLKLKSIAKNSSHETIYIAHSTYYAFLASFSGVQYISTPQGSEVLVRPRNTLYRWFANRAHSKARFVTVDSVNMQSKAMDFFQIKPVIIQNGIQAGKLTAMKKAPINGKGLLSIRGFAPNYQIVDILNAKRDHALYPLKLCFPFGETEYVEKVHAALRENDQILGKLARDDFHAVLNSTSIVISIPVSDSSPRSVYEAIFSGAKVICTANSFLDMLPSSMRKRIIVVDIMQDDWLEDAIVKCERICDEFYPCKEALIMFDQVQSMRKVMELATLIDCTNS